MNDIFSQFSFQGKNASNKYVTEEVFEPTPTVDLPPKERTKTTVEKIRKETSNVKVAVKETEKIYTMMKDPNIAVKAYNFVLPNNHKGQIIEEFMFVPPKKSEE